MCVVPCDIFEKRFTAASPVCATIYRLTYLQDIISFRYRQLKRQLKAFLYGIELITAHSASVTIAYLRLRNTVIYLLAYLLTCLRSTAK